jgi:hypothetical protein
VDNGDNSDAEYLLPALVLDSDELFDPFEAPFEVIGSEVGSSPHGKALDGLKVGHLRPFFIQNALAIALHVEVKTWHSAPTLWRPGSFIS